jgi:pyrimidine deaminase RibD-like protein
MYVTLEPCTHVGKNAAVRGRDHRRRCIACCRRHSRS